MSKRRIVFLCFLAVPLAVILVLVRDWVDLFWQGPSEKPHKPVQVTRAEFSPTLRMTIHEARLGPDGLRQFVLATPPPPREMWNGPDGQGWHQGRRNLPHAPRPRPMLYTRANPTGDLRPIPGTEGAQAFSVSPSGGWVAFVAPDSDRANSKTLWLTAVHAAGPPSRMVPWGPDWDQVPVWISDELLVVPRGRASSLLLISRREGQPRSVPITGGVEIRALGICSQVPGRAVVLCDVVATDGLDQRRGFGVLDIATGQLKILDRDGGSPHYIGNNQLVFARGARPFLVGFDPKKSSLVGSAIPLRCRLDTPGPGAHASFDIAANGNLSQSSSGGSDWGDRGIVHRGGERDHGGSSEFRGAFEGNLAASPDGNVSAVEVVSGEGYREIWQYRDIKPFGRRLVSVPGENVGAPTWSPDGKFMAYARLTRSALGGIYVLDLDGFAAPRQLASNSATRVLVPTSWSHDGSTILCTIQDARGTRIAEVRTTVMAPQQPRPLFDSGETCDQARFSMDDRLIAFEGGSWRRPEVFVAPWTDDHGASPSLQVSASGGQDPRWGHDGFLYYRSLDGLILRTRVETQGTLHVIPAVPTWNESEYGVADGLYDILPDGRILFVCRGGQEGARHVLTIIPRFTQQLAELVQGVP